MITSDFIWQSWTLNIGVILNPKTGCIFSTFVSIFPIELKKNIRVFSFQSRPRHCAIDPFTGSWSKLDFMRGKNGALPILQVSKLCNNFQLKTFSAHGGNRMFSYFTDYWLLGHVVLDPAVHYLAQGCCVV